MPTPRTIKVFIASPGDLAVERRAFKDVLEELNAGFGDALNIKFEPLGWEDTLATTGRRSQEVINKEIDRCDVFILAMHRRWGQAAPDAMPYSSYTEEEFYRALNRWKAKPNRKKSQAPEIFVFFKHVDSAAMRDPGPQLKMVLDFRRQLEESRQVLYHEFADEVEFKAKVDRHLRAFAKGELPKADAPLDKVILPNHVIEEVQKERAEKEAALEKAEREHNVAEAAIARAEALSLAMAERASKAALEGRVEEARQDFAKATDGTANLRVLFLAFEFYHRTGDLATAEELLERWLAISSPDAETADTAAAFGNLGLIYETRGDLDRAEETHLKSLAINEKLGREDGSAADFGNLGLIYATRGDLDRAQEMHLKSLAINEKLGRQEGMAANYGNLGLIYQTRGDLDRAEKMHLKSLAIEEKLDRFEGIAANYGNLGLIYRQRGELDLAEEVHFKSLAIEEKLGRPEGMANDYGSLGLVARARGDLKQARQHLTKARDLYARIGMPHMVARAQELLDGLHQGGSPQKKSRTTLVTDRKNGQATDPEIAMSADFYKQIEKRERPDSAISTAPVSRLPNNEPEPLRKVFVSYSHLDSKWLDDLKTMLRPVLRDKKFELWDDTRIKAGSLWKEQIKGAINSAQVAVLLVSKHFLASEFIANDELPPLLAAAKDRGLTILWVYVGHCLWHCTDIQHYQAAHPILHPLSSLDEHDQDRVVRDICEEILRASKAEFRSA